MRKRGQGAIYSWLLQLREEHAEGSRTHYLAGSGAHCGNWQGLLLVKNKVGHVFVWVMSMHAQLAG
jgi:hypothetical protein